jgi:SAM-dependent methyltransferase
MSEALIMEIEASTELLMRKYFRDGGRVLDVGVGLGGLLSRIENANRHGMDISLKYLEQAKSRGIDVCMSKVEDMPYSHELFDMVVTTDVLEHVFNFNVAVENILSVLKVGGILVVRVPYRENLSHYLRQDCPYDYVHLRNFDEWSLMLQFEKEFRCKTLEIQKTGYCGGTLRLPLPPIPKLRGAVARCIDACKFLGSRTHRKISKFLRQPSEINVVFQKTHRTGFDSCAA